MATETRRDGIDLILTRYYAAPPEKLWQAWTDVDVLKTWFAPDPVKITEAVFDARPGGLFQITMLLPDGTEVMGLIVRGSTFHSFMHLLGYASNRARNVLRLSGKDSIRRL